MIKNQKEYGAADRDVIQYEIIRYDMKWYDMVQDFKLNSEEFSKNAEHMLLIELVDDDIYLCALQNWMLIDIPNI